MVGVRVAHYRVFTQDVHRLDTPVDEPVHHLGNHVTNLVRELGVPGVFKLCPNIVIGHNLISRVDVGQTTHVAGPLDIVLATQGIYTG